MKTLLITGGSGGLGTAVVARLQRDYQCVLLGRDELASDDALRAALQPAYGIVHLVGGFAAGSVADTTLETWNEMLTLNVTLAFRVFHEALRVLERPGRIVAISSEATLRKAAGVAAYFVGKSALNALVSVTAAEVAGTGITVNALLPGSLDTPATRQSMPKAKLVPLDRVAESIVFLLSDAAASVSGALIPLQP